MRRRAIRYAVLSYVVEDKGAQSPGFDWTKPNRPSDSDVAVPDLNLIKSHGFEKAYSCDGNYMISGLAMRCAVHCCSELSPSASPCLRFVWAEPFTFCCGHPLCLQ